MHAKRTLFFFYFPSAKAFAVHLGFGSPREFVIFFHVEPQRQVGLFMQHLAKPNFVSVLPALAKLGVVPRLGDNPAFAFFRRFCRSACSNFSRISSNSGDSRKCPRRAGVLAFRYLRLWGWWGTIPPSSLWVPTRTSLFALLSSVDAAGEWNQRSRGA